MPEPALAAGEHWAEDVPLAEAFRTFDDANPQVYRELVRLVEYWIGRRGRGKLGMKMLWEVMRWNLAVRTDSTDPFLLNNNHTSFYARKLMTHHLPSRHLFDIRGRDGRCECTFCDHGRRSRLF